MIVDWIDIDNAESAAGRSISLNIADDSTQRRFSEGMKHKNNRRFVGFVGIGIFVDEFDVFVCEFAAAIIFFGFIAKVRNYLNSD